MMALLVMVLVGCDEQTMSDRVLAQNSMFCVTGDSVVQGTLMAWAPSPLQLSNNLNLNNAEAMLQRMAGTDTVPYCLASGQAAQMVRNSRYPTYQSSQTLIDALYNLAVSDIENNHSRSGGFNSYQDQASLNAAIYLSLAMIDADQAKATLAAQVEDGLVMQQQGTWPVCDDRMSWPIAAWEVYCATGDKQWLAQAYDITLNTIDEQLQVQGDASLGLMHGGQLTRYNAGDFYPDWADAIAVTEVLTMINNVLAIRAMEVAGLMADELGLEAPYQGEARHLRDAVNQRLWDEGRGRYCAYVMGYGKPIQSPLTDNMAQALAVLWSLADDDRSSTLVENTPVGHQGILPTYPAQCVEPYLEYPSWTLTQACWNMAAAAVGNEHALRRGMAALYRAQALYGPQHITRGQRMVNTLASGAANIAMVMRLMMGIRLMPDGIEFDPCVPVCLTGNKTLLNVAYRSATLDITLVGTGNDIESIALDGQALEGNFVPADIEGHHNLLIKLKKGRKASQHVTLASKALLPATPDVHWTTDSAVISPWRAHLAHKLIINGALSYSLDDSVFGLPPLPPLAQLWVVTANRYGYSVPSRPLLVAGTAAKTVTLADSTLQADTLATHVRVDHAGTYLLGADYRIDRGCDIVIVEANGHAQGVLYLPATAAIAPRRTNLATVRLLRGDNIITLRRYRIGYRAALRQLVLWHTADSF